MRAIVGKRFLVSPAFAWLATGLSLIMGCGCGKRQQFGAEDSYAVESVVSGNTTFGLALYTQLAKRDGNLFFSPYSISKSFGMIYAGTRGQTAEEIAKGLHFAVPSEDVNIAFNGLATRIGEGQRRNRVALRTGLSLWCQKDYPLAEDFLKLAHAKFQTDVQLVDFKSGIESVNVEINSWVHSKTGEKAENRPTSLITDDTRLVLCSSIYFKRKWASQFNVNDTKSAPFFLAPKRTISVPMMYRKSHFKMSVDNDPALVELPYSGKNFSMVILLPASRDGLPRLEEKLNAHNLNKWLLELDMRSPDESEIWLPRFKTAQSLSLKTALTELGITSIFSQEMADLSGMTPTHDLFLSDAIHEASVEVDETGTEASATTSFYLATTSALKGLNVDHPFLFLIRENKTGSILFLGRIVDPSN